MVKTAVECSRGDPHTGTWECVRDIAKLNPVLPQGDLPTSGIPNEPVDEFRPHDTVAGTPSQHEDRQCLTSH